MIATMSLSDEIASEAADLRASFPKGATPHDLAGWFAQPLPRIEEALAAMREAGADLSFVRLEPEKNPAAVAMGQRGGRARAEKVAPERRSAIAREAATRRWSNPNQKPHPNKKSLTAPQQRAMGALARIPALAASYPTGCSTQECADFFGFSKEHTYETVRVFEAMGVAVWCNDGVTGNGTHKTLYVKGMVRPPPPLSDKQETVYGAIAQLGKDGRATVNYNELGRAVGIHATSVMQICFTLEKKGYVKRLTPWNGPANTSPEYAVYPPTPREPDFDVEPRRMALIGAAEYRPTRADDEMVTKAKQRRIELMTELAKLDAFLELYGELSDEGE